MQVDQEQKNSPHPQQQNKQPNNNNNQEEHSHSPPTDAPIPFGLDNPDDTTNCTDALQNRQMSVASNIHLLRIEGYLQKRQNKFPHLYHKRYFKLTKSGDMLLYYNEEPKGTQKPSAAIQFSKVMQIRKTQNKLKFEIQHQSRVFKIRAKTQQQRDKWFIALNQAFKQFEEIQTKQDQKIRLSSSYRPASVAFKNLQQTASQKNNYKFQNLDNKIVQSLLTDSPSLHLAIKGGQNMTIDQKFIKNKGVLKYINKVDKKKINSRMIYGVLDKRSKGNMKYWMKRWMILVSSRPLNQEQYITDQYILEENHFPVWLEFDVIYYFKAESEDDQTGNIGEIQMKNVVKCQWKNMSQSHDRGHTFIIDTGVKKYHFNTKNKYEMDRWIAAIDLSRKTVKEREMSITKQNKNISKLLKEYEENQEEFRNKLIKDSDAMFAKKDSLDDFDEIIDISRELSDSLIGIFDACLAQQPPRNDVLQFYMQIQHTKMIEFLGKYWENHALAFSAYQIISLMQWSHQYNQKLKQFGIQDDEIHNGFVTLCNAYTSKISQKIIPTIANILNTQRQADPQTNHENQSLYTNAPNDIFKLFSHSLDIARSNGFHQLIKQIVKFLRQMLGQYQDALYTVIERYQIQPQKRTIFRIASLNNTFIFNGQLRQLCNKLQSNPTPLSEAQVEQSINLPEINKKFAKIAGVIRRQLIEEYFNDKNISKIFNQNFIDLPLKQLLNSVSDQFSLLITNYVHPVLQQPFWVGFLERIIKDYVQCFFNSSSKLRQIGHDGLINLMKEHLEIFEQLFKDDYLNISSYDALMEVIQDILNFLQSTPDFISLPCTKLAEANGKAFKLSIVKALLALRSDIQKDEKADILKSCKEIIQKYATTKPSKSLLSGIDTTKAQEISKESSSKNTGKQLESPPQQPDFDQFLKQGGINLQQQEDDLQEEQQNKSPNQTQRQKVSEDYDISDELMKKSKFKQKNVGDITTPTQFITNKFMRKWQKRYIELKGNNMYWYTDKKAKLSRNHLELKNVIKVYPRKESQFVILLKGDKPYCFKANNEQQRQKWIEAINKKKEFIAKNDPTNPDRYKHVKIFQNVSGKSMFKDYLVMQEAKEKEDAEKEYKKQKADQKKRQSTVLGRVSPIKIPPKRRVSIRDASPLRGLSHYKTSILSRSMSKNNQESNVTKINKFQIGGEDVQTKKPNNQEEDKENDDVDSLPDRGSCVSCFFGWFSRSKKKKKKQEKQQQQQQQQKKGKNKSAIIEDDGGLV